MQNSHDVITIHDKKGILKYKTPSANQILGYEPSVLIGKNIFNFVHPDDRQVALDGFEMLFRDNPGKRPTEYRVRHADGHWVYLESIGVNLLEHPEIEGILITTRDITQRKETERYLHRITEALEQSLNGVAIIGEQGKIQYANHAFASMHGYTKDEIIEMPLDAFHTQDQVKKRIPKWQEKLFSEGKNEGTLRRKRKDNSTFISRTFATLHESDPENTIGIAIVQDITTEIYKKIEFIRDAANKARGLTQKLLAFSHKQVLEMSTLNLCDIIADFKRILRHSLRVDIQIITEFQCSQCLIKGDESQIHQVLMNLAINAQDALPDGGVIRINIQTIDLSPSEAEKISDISAGPYIQLKVEDTGTGISTKN